MSSLAKDFIVIDNGGGYVKFGVQGERFHVTVPNVTARPKKDLRTLVAQDTESGVSNHGELIYTRPLQRGYLTDYDTQVKVWERNLGEDGWDISQRYPRHKRLILTRPAFAPSECCKLEDELVFEYFGFEKRVVENAASLAVRLNTKEDIERTCCVVIDFGYSFTTVTPVIGGEPYLRGIKRIDIGGKLLTNYLKELLSYRHFNLLDETYVIEQARRKLCFVSQDFHKDMATCAQRARSNSLLRHYALPNYHTLQEGTVVSAANEEKLRADESIQVLPVGNERFVVPELYFHPSDLGLNQAGVHEAVEQAIADCPPEAQRMLESNVLLTGGNSQTEGLIDRLRKELGGRYSVRRTEQDPMETPLLGAMKHYGGGGEGHKGRSISKAEYEEEGADRLVSQSQR